MAGRVDFDALVLGPCMDTFGERDENDPNKGGITFIPGAGAPIPGILGIFDRNYVLIDYETDPPVAATMPMLGCREAAFSGRIPAENEQFLIKNEFWAVKRVHPDGLGHLKIFLHGPL